jgi:hypothetical protein
MTPTPDRQVSCGANHASVIALLSRVVHYSITGFLPAPAESGPPPRRAGAARSSVRRGLGPIWFPLRPLIAPSCPARPWLRAPTTVGSFSATPMRSASSVPAWWSRSRVGKRPPPTGRRAGVVLRCRRCRRCPRNRVDPTGRVGAAGIDGRLGACLGDRQLRLRTRPARTTTAGRTQRLLTAISPLGRHDRGGCVGNYR